MSNELKIERIKSALQKYRWNKADVFKRDEQGESFGPFGMLLRAAGVSVKEFTKENSQGHVYSLARKHHKLLFSEYGLKDVTDLQIITTAGDCSISAEDMVWRVTEALSGNLSVFPAGFRSWMSSLVEQRNELGSLPDLSSSDKNKGDAGLQKTSEVLFSSQSELATALQERPKFIVALAEKGPTTFTQLALFVWTHSDQFIRWPKKAYCFWPGLVRANGTGRTTCYEYSQEQLALIAQAGLEPRAWNNDPAIFAFKLAEGERPQRADWKWEWTIHHIYDGKFEAQTGWQITHAVRHPAYFTEAAGLVALHPIADSLASEVALFAWLLRHEAFKRFGFDPDGVFNRLP